MSQRISLKQRFRHAKRWVRLAGHMLKDAHQQKKHRVNFKSKGQDPVTKTDILIESYLVKHLMNLDPRAQILTEESGLLGPKRSHMRWILDPLDGTVNFIHRVPHCAISLAFEHKEKLLFGIIYNPFREELFWGIHGRGAYLNGKSLHVSTVDSLGHSIISTGFNFSMMDRLDPALGIFKGFLLSTMGVRRSGSAALDISYVAAGLYDGFYEESLQPWDVAAGLVILQEAGGHVSDFRGQDCSIYDKELVASNGVLHSQMLEVIQWGLKMEIELPSDMYT